MFLAEKPTSLNYQYTRGDLSETWYYGDYLRKVKSWEENLVYKMEKHNHLFANFDTFLNEAVRTKFPEYKVGDEVLLLGYHEFQYSTKVPVTKWETYSKYATYSETGAMGKIVIVDTEKKEYVIEFTGGILRTVYRGNRGGYGSNSTADKNSPLIYLRVKQIDISTEGLPEIQKLLKANQFLSGEKVTVKISAEKSVTRKLVGVSLTKTLENKKLTYLIDGVSGTVPGNLIEKEIDISDEVAQELLAEEIAKVLGTKMEETRGSGLSRDFVYEIAKLEGKSLITGELFFKNNNEREKFIVDLQKFIDKSLNKNLQKIMCDGESSEVKVIGISSGMSSWYRGKISAQKVIQAARNIGINVKDFLEKKRGAITGKKFGI